LFLGLNYITGHGPENHMLFRINGPGREVSF